MRPSSLTPGASTNGTSRRSLSMSPQRSSSSNSWWRLASRFERYFSAPIWTGWLRYLFTRPSSGPR